MTDRVDLQNNFNVATVKDAFALSTKGNSIKVMFSL